MRKRKFHALKTLMYEQEVNQDEMAVIVGRSKTYLSYRMTGKEPFNTEDIVRIAKALDIPSEQWVSLFFEGVLN